MSAHPVTEFDVFFLSYDEPNAEKHWADLTDKAPWAKRVHGVKGFASAHQECARQSETDWFVTVDADNIVSPEFFDTEVELDRNPLQCYSWAGRNMINGLQYGNGGLKLWSKSFVLSDRIGHEASTDGRVDFCWDENYKQIDRTFSEVWPNGSAYQAFRAGFREGVKLSLDRGEAIDPNEMKSRIHPQNLRNLRVWCSVGADVEHGLWAMYGARRGWSGMLNTNFDHKRVSDFSYLEELWEAVKDRDVEQFHRGLRITGSDIKAATGYAVPLLSVEESEFFRSVLS